MRRGRGVKGSMMDFLAPKFESLARTDLSNAGWQDIVTVTVQDTLHVDAIGCQEIDELLTLRRALGIGAADPVYLQTLKAMVRQNPGIDLPGRSSRVQTAVELANAENQMKRALVGGLIGDEGMLQDEPEPPSFG